MSCPRNLISIGALSKRTGVPIKCLRYYDQIGVLRPAYINPRSGYRYYAATQVCTVEIIRLFLDLDIPLRDLASYVDRDGDIDFAALLDWGQRAAEEKLQNIRRGLELLTALRGKLEQPETRSHKGRSVCQNE